MKISQRLVLGFIGTSLSLGFLAYSQMTNSEIKHSALIVSKSIKTEVEGVSDMLLALQANQIAMHQLLEIQALTDASERKTVKPKIVIYCQKKLMKLKLNYTKIFKIPSYNKNGRKS